jgi:hypothetical protein
MPFAATLGVVGAFEGLRELRAWRKAQGCKVADARTAVVHLVGEAYVRGALATLRASNVGAVPSDIEAFRETLAEAGVRQVAAVAADGMQAAIIRNLDVCWDEAAEGMHVFIGIDVINVF